MQLRKNQVLELIAYATSQLGLDRLAVLYPDSDTGREFAGIFRSGAGVYGAVVVSEIDYDPRDKGDDGVCRGGVGVSKPSSSFLSLMHWSPHLESWKRLKSRQSPKQFFLDLRNGMNPIAIRGYGQLLGRRNLRDPVLF